MATDWRFLRYGKPLLLACERDVPCRLASERQSWLQVLATELKCVERARNATFSSGKDISCEASLALPVAACPGAAVLGHSDWRNALLMSCEDRRPAAAWHAFRFNVAKRATKSRRTLIGEIIMLYWAAVFFVIALLAAFFGFGGLAAGAAGIAKILFFVFLVLAVVSLIFGRRVPT